MEAEKRKREDDRKMDGKRAKEDGVDGGGETAVTEDEVEEFFAILRRIHVAVKYFEKTDGKKWRPLMFEKEGLGGVNGVNVVDGEKKAEDHDSGSQNLGLDLNSDPPLKGDAV